MAMIAPEIIGTVCRISRQRDESWALGYYIVNPAYTGVKGSGISRGLYQDFIADNCAACEARAKELGYLTVFYGKSMQQVSLP